MQEKLALGDGLSAQVIRGRGLSDSLGEFKFKYRTTQYRDGKLIHTDEGFNTVTNEGKQHLLNVAFAGGTAKGTWYVALVDNAGTPTAPAATQVYDTFFDTVNVEYTNYTSGTRVEFTETVAAGPPPTVNNTAAKAAFTFNTSSGVLYGAALVSNSTKSHHAAGDYLMSFKGFDNPISVQVNDVVNVEIILSW